MNAHYVLHPDQGYLESTFEGSVTLVEIGLHIQQVWADPGWNPAFNGFLDFSRASVDLSDDDLRSLLKAMLRDPRCSLARFAIVVATADDFRVFRKVDVLSEEQSTIRIFFNKTEAERWLLQPQKERRDQKPGV
jgi:hypothetical protein